MTYGIASGIVDNQRAVARPRRCPRDGQPISGGPIVYHCPAGHGLQAADLDEGTP